jgi:S1-C subfamily serine protease
MAVDGKDYSPEKSRALGDIWSKWERDHRPGDYVELRLERDGYPVAATLQCGDGHAFANLMVAAIDDLIDARWQSCLLNVARAEIISGPMSGFAGIRLQCQFNAKLNRWAIAQSQYNYADLLLREKRATGKSVDAVRGQVLGIIASLESSGFTLYAQDLNTQLSTFTAPIPPKATTASVTGTCFAVSPVGDLATAYHIVKNAKQIRVMLANGSWEEAELSESSPANDVAILKLRVQTPEFLSLAPPRSAQVGQRVFTIGFPAVSLLGIEPKFSEGAISALSGPGGERTFIQVTVPIQPGSSGGPLVNESGRVLGLMTSTAAILPFVRITGSLPQNINWAINADVARPLIESRSRAQTRTREEAIQQTLRALCLVEAKS